MRKATKTITSFAVVLIAGLNFIVPAFAQDPFTSIAIGGFSGLSGAGLFSSMAAGSGVNLNWGNNDPVQIDAIWSSLHPDHVYFSGEKHEATGQGEDIYDYIQVDIGDWLEAQTDFISEFCSNYSVIDNSSGNTGNIAEFNGIPLNVNLFGMVGSDYLATGIQPDSGSLTLSSGPFTCISTIATSGRDVTYFYNGTQVGAYHDNNPRVGQTLGLRLRLSGNNVTMQSFALTGYGSTESNVIGLASTAGASWTSGTVNLSVYDGWEKAKVKIPKSVSTLQSGWTLSDFLNELNRIWYGAGEDNIIIEEGSDTPIPPTPIPDTPLGEVPFDDWVDLWGQGIYQQLENQSDALDLIGSNGIDAIEELESIDTNTEDLVEVAESIDTNIGVGNGILGGIRSLAQSAVNYLEGIAENVGELVEEIVESTETLIAGILNQIPQVFGVIFGPIKQASSIWHYVVEWIHSIGAPFQFIWSMASGTSYYIILPVYASLAAAVVLAFYKRFGK